MNGAGEIFSVSFEEYLEREDGSAQRHEYVGGRVYAMAGGTERHDLAAGLVYEALAPGARAQGCRPFTANRKLRTASAAYYPDVLVVCGPAAHRLYERTPRSSSRCSPGRPRPRTDTRRRCSTPSCPA